MACNVTYSNWLVENTALKSKVYNKKIFSDQIIDEWLLRCKLILGSNDLLPILDHKISIK